MRVYSQLLELALPHRCPGCGMPAARGFCRGCRADLERIHDPCTRCGAPRPRAACPRAGGGWAVDAVVAPLRYAPPLKAYVQALKFAGDRSLGRALGQVLAECLAATPSAADVAAVVAVPLHRERLLARGYNQANEIARAVAKHLGVRLLVAGIARTRATPPQSQLAAAERRTNMRDAFAVTRRLRGREIAIVDDVMTTGATVNALALELKRAGARFVWAWTVARSL